MFGGSGIGLVYDDSIPGCACFTCFTWGSEGSMLVFRVRHRYEAAARSSSKDAGDANLFTPNSSALFQIFDFLTCIVLFLLWMGVYL
jgi:hypothetical protein